MKRIPITAILLMLSVTAFSSEVLWGSNKESLAFCQSGTHTVCFVIANNIATDVSGIEGKNLGKLGLALKEDYEKIETFPSKWIEETESGNPISFTTRVWKNGERFTAKGPVFVNKNGVYIEQ